MSRDEQGSQQSGVKQEEQKGQSIQKLVASIFPEPADKEIFWKALWDKEITSPAQHHAAMMGIVLIKFVQENSPDDLTSDPDFKQNALAPVMDILNRAKEKQKSLQKESKKAEIDTLAVALVACSVTTQPKPQSGSAVQTSNVLSGGPGSGT